ncbi:hypothetical protein HB779_08240 [Phyllobacterium sp. 628]|nr:hypothetical protein HB779_08240 [Phyllobacterium sp. 628]
MMDLAKDWLGANISTLTTYRQDEIPDLGGWSELFQNWREHNLEKFNDILNRAADFHVEQSHDMVEQGRDDDPDYVLKHFEIEEDKYWIFPVLLLAVLRLREWEGIKNPELTHDLFWVSPLGRLPEIPPVPSDQFYDAVDAKFRKMFPATPTLADLPRLRSEQS